MGDLIGLASLLAAAAATLLVALAVLLAWSMTHPPRRTMAYALARGLPAEPEEAGLAADAWTLDRPDGATLPVRTIVGRVGAALPQAVLVHGWGQSRIDMLARSAPWLARAQRVTILDLRGHGEAGGACGFGKHEADDLRELVARLDRPCVLAGFSMGATIALRAAAAGDARILGVVAAAPYESLAGATTGRLRERGLPAGPVVAVATALLRALRVPTRGATAAARRVAAPILVMHAQRDPVVPVSEAEAVARAAARGRLVRLDSAAHLELERDDPDGFAAALDAWIGELAPPSDDGAGSG